MPSLLDRIPSSQMGLSQWLENVGDQLLEPARGLGSGRHYQVINAGSRQVLVEEQSSHSLLYRIGSAALFPLTLAAAVAALVLKWSARLFSPSLAEKYAFTVLSYPVAKRLPQGEMFHGTRVDCPYHWLEREEDKDTKQWIEAQCALTKGYLKTLDARKEIKERLLRLWNFERCSSPRKAGDFYFWRHNPGLANQSVLYFSQGLEGERQPLIDPNELSSEGTVSLEEYDVSEDGRWIAYALSEKGSDWRTLHVRSVTTGTELRDKLEWVNNSTISWDKGDYEGFYYSRYPKPEEGKALVNRVTDHKLYYHKMGTPQSEDRLVYEEVDHPTYEIIGQVSHDGRYLLIYQLDGCRNECALKLLPLNPRGEIRPLFSQWDARYEYVHNEGSKFWFLTDNDAPRRRLIEVDADHPEPDHWREVLPESEDCLEEVQVSGSRLIAHYQHHAHSELRIFEKDGTSVGTLPLPDLGVVTGLQGQPEEAEFFFTFSSFAHPGTVYRVDSQTLASEVWHQPLLHFDPDDFATRQVFATSKDGTQVPLFVVSKKELSQDEPQPTLLYGYGGFDISIRPFFSPANLQWMEQGGVLCVANLRGGGEYGRDWHEAGTKLHKQNVFDDFIAAAEWLIAEGITTPQQLAIEGRSNGGLLVGAVLNQRPDLFKAALAHVGVMDMLRFNRFTIGKAWESDFGSPQNPEEFKAIAAYSPLHNLKRDATYPAVMVTTSDHDDRVVPSHSYKYTAALQAIEPFKLERPHLIRITRDAGHGAGRSTAQTMKESVDRLAFLSQHLS